MDYVFDYPVQRNLAPEFLSEKQAGRIYARIGFGFFALTVLFNGLTLGAQWIVYLFFPHLYIDWFVALISFAMLYLVSVPIFALIIYRLPKFPPQKSRLSFGDFLKIFTVCYALTYVGALVSSFFTMFFRVLSGRELTDPTQSITENSVWVNIIFVVILAPVFEELVFRKLLCDRLLFFGERDAVVISALAFGLMHGNFQQVVYATLVGLVLGIVYVRTGKVKITIAYHMILNFLGGIAVPFLADPLAGDFDLNIINELLILLSAIFYFLVMFAVVICGTVFFFIRIRHFRFRRNGLVIDKKYKALFANPRTILALAAFGAQFVLQIIFS